MKERSDNQSPQISDEQDVSSGGKTENLPKHSHHDDEIIEEVEVAGYWRENLNLMLSLLAVWFLVSFGFGILLVDFLNQFQFFGFKLGFWWAQQGSIYVFVLLIFVYVVRMKQIDRKHGVDDDSDDEEEQQGS